MAEEVKQDKNVLISWSGSRSEAVAKALYEWLPKVIQVVRPWMSKPDIDKGSRWAEKLAEQLEKTSVGIICLTPENITAPWILFEAGAISKTVESSYACTYLFDLEHTEIELPLAQFQHTKAEKEDTKQLLGTINRALGTPGGGPPIVEAKLETIFEKWWSDLDNALNNVPPQKKGKPPKRKQEDKIDDILRAVRRLEKAEGSYTVSLPRVRTAGEAVYVPAGDYVPVPDLDERLVNVFRVKAGHSTFTVAEPLKPEGDDKGVLEGPERKGKKDDK